MRERLTIVKVGGAVVEDEGQLSLFLRHFIDIDGKKMLVHGGGRRATQVAAQMGIETRMVEGRRVTDAQMLQVVTMVYGGLVNKGIVARLQGMGVDAVGLTGADADVMRSVRRPPVEVSSGGVRQTVDYGLVGDVQHVDASKMAHFIDTGAVIVMAPLTHDGRGQLLNTNADTIASEAAKALAATYDVTLVYAFEKPGVLSRPDDDSSVVPLITRDVFDRLRADGTVSGGMLPKIENALRAVEAGVGRVVITRAADIATGGGTCISL